MKEPFRLQRYKQRFMLGKWDWEVSDSLYLWSFYTTGFMGSAEQMWGMAYSLTALYCACFRLLFVLTPWSKEECESRFASILGKEGKDDILRIGLILAYLDDTQYFKFHLY